MRRGICDREVKAKRPHVLVLPREAANSVGRLCRFGVRLCRTVPNPRRASAVGVLGRRPGARRKVGWEREYAPRAVTPPQTRQ